MRGLFSIAAFLIILFSCSRSEDKTAVNAEELSVNLLQQIQTNQPYSKHLDSLEFGSVEGLTRQLTSDEKKKAFWINLYNSFVQIRIKENPVSYQNTSAFFEYPSFTISGTKLSMKEIQLVFLGGQNTPKHLAKLHGLKVKKKDLRILFALICGSVSCPPIAYYDSEKIDLQLELAESVFIKSDCTYDPFSDQVKVPELLNQLLLDNSSDKTIISLLKKHQIIPIQADPEIIFTPYNWSPQLPEFR